MGIILYYSCARQWKKTFRRKTSFQENLFFFFTFFDAWNKVFHKTTQMEQKSKSLRIHVLFLCEWKEIQDCYVVKPTFEKKISCVLQIQNKNFTCETKMKTFYDTLYISCVKITESFCIFILKKNVNCLSLGFTTNYFLGANKFSCEANFFFHAWKIMTFSLLHTWKKPLHHRTKKPSLAPQVFSSIK